MVNLLTLNELADWMTSARLKIKVENVLRLLCSASIMRYQSADEKNHFDQLPFPYSDLPFEHYFQW
jgi:hypothetical protein